MLAAIASIYVVFAVATFVYNERSIVGPVNYVTVIRNAVLWPIFLPVLIAINSR